MIEATIFIGAVIAGATQAVKTVFPEINGKLTILVAVLVGILVALIDVNIGVKDITIANGIMIALGTVGVFTAVDRV